MPNPAVTGLIQGLTQGFAQGMQLSKMRQDQGIRREYVNAQKKLLDAKLKKEEAQQNWLAMQPESVQNALKLGNKDLAALLSYADQGQPVTPPATGAATPTQRSSVTPSGTPGAQDVQAGGQGSSLTELIAQANTDPVLRGLVKKALGYDPSARTYRGGLEGPGGAPTTKVYNALGKEVEAFPEATKPDLIKSTTPEGAPAAQYYDPYTQQARGPRLSLGPPKIEQRGAQLEDGTKIDYDMNPQTGEVIRVRIAEQPDLEGIRTTNPKTGEEELKFINPRIAGGEGGPGMVTKPAGMEIKTWVDKETGVGHAQYVNKITKKPIGKSWVDTVPINRLLTAEVGKNVQEIKTLQDMTGLVDDLFKPEYVGPIAGRVGKASEKYIGFSEDRATFYSALANIKNFILKMRSGGAVTVEEAQRVLDEIPTEAVSVTQYKANMKRLKFELAALLSNRLAASKVGAFTGPSVKKPTKSQIDRKETDVSRQEKLNNILFGNQ